MSRASELGNGYCDLLGVRVYLPQSTPCFCGRPATQGRYCAKCFSRESTVLEKYHWRLWCQTAARFHDVALSVHNDAFCERVASLEMRAMLIEMATKIESGVGDAAIALLGPLGSGKTTCGYGLLRAAFFWIACRAEREFSAEEMPMAVKASDLLAEARLPFAAPRPRWEQASRTPWLLLDDFGRTPDFQACLSRLVDRRMADGLPIIYTTPCASEAELGRVLDATLAARVFHEANVITLGGDEP